MQYFKDDYLESLTSSDKPGYLREAKNSFFEWVFKEDIESSSNNLIIVELIYVMPQTHRVYIPLRTPKPYKLDDLKKIGGEEYSSKTMIFKNGTPGYKASEESIEDSSQYKLSKQLNDEEYRQLKIKNESKYGKSKEKKHGVLDSITDILQSGYTPEKWS